MLRVDHDLLASIEGPSRELVFEQATRFLRLYRKHIVRREIAAMLESPGLRGRDGWTIVVGADISFAATPIVHIPDAATAEATERTG